MSGYYRRPTDGALIEEMDVRQWFKTVDLDQAQDTFRVVQGILEMRAESQPKRKRRKDAGLARDKSDDSHDLFLGATK